MKVHGSVGGHLRKLINMVHDFSEEVSPPVTRQFGKWHGSPTYPVEPNLRIPCMTCQDGFGQSGLVVRDNPNPNLIRDVFTGRIKLSSRVEHR